MIANASFLTSGDSYVFDIPKTVDPEPDLYGIVRLDGGAREIVYEPRSRRRDPDLEDGLKRLFDVRRGGVRVSVYETLEDPVQLVAFWRLGRGYVVTFMNDDTECGADLEAGIRTVIAHTTVGTTRYGLPVLAFREPLHAGDLRDPFQRQMILFHPKAPDYHSPTIKLTRQPPWAREGKATRGAGNTAVASFTNDLEITVTVYGTAEEQGQLERHAVDVASSVAPLP